MTDSIVILAAGLGKRMYSNVPKVLHPLAGKPMLERLIETCLTLKKDNIFVIIGHQADKIKSALKHYPVTFIEQKEQLGTGHAVLQALPLIPKHHRVLILYGDVPLISQATLENFTTKIAANELGIITTEVLDPTGFGRIIRDKANHIIKIVEEKDATLEEKKIHEINSGIYFVSAAFLNDTLPTLTHQNIQQEYYLTDIIEKAVKHNYQITSVRPFHYQEILGVNDRIQQAALERFYQEQQAVKYLQQGATILDPLRFDVRGNLTIGKEAIIDVNAIFEGNVVIGDYCQIGANTFLKNVILQDYVEIKANSYIENATIGSHSVVGPFARIRAETHIADHVQIGNFIEIKKSVIGAHSKIHHVGYIGDSELGSKVNIGAGTITCNFDGANKHKTVIGDGAFIGSNTELVAPVIIGEGATIGAGTTITRDVPPNQLAVSRTKQANIPNWQRKKKEEV